MSDTITAKGSDTKFKTHEPGQFIGVCVDTIDLGDNVETFTGTPPKLAHKCVLVFRTGERNEETGEYIDVSREFTVSMGEKANLRKFLEQWRGKQYTPEQLDEGVPLHKLTNQPGLLTVTHKQSAKGNTYALIAACVGVPKQMVAGIGKYTDYKRDEYWEKKKAEYAEATRKFRGETSAPSGDDFNDFPTSNGDSDDLPFN